MFYVIWICNIDLTLRSGTSYLLTSLQFVFHVISSPERSFRCLGLSVVSFMLLSLFLFLDEEWQCDQNFMRIFTFYLLVTFNPYPFDLNEESAHVGAFNLSVTNFFLTFVLITWLKPSNQSCGLRLTPSSTAAHHTGWLLYVSTSLRAQDLI